jgi:cytochrome P450
VDAYRAAELRGTGLFGLKPAVVAIVFHRPEEQLSVANTFSPVVWLDDGVDYQGVPPRTWPLVPFSGGPAICPGRNLVLLLASNMLAALVDDHALRLVDADRLPPSDLPGTLDNYSLRFHIGA